VSVRIQPPTEDAATRRRNCCDGGPRDSLTKDPQGVCSPRRMSSPGNPSLRLCAVTQQQQPPIRQNHKVKPNTTDQRQFQPPTQQTGQSVQAPTVHSSPLDDMFKVATVVQQIMTGLNGAVSEEEKIVAITKIVLNLMRRDGH
jgi:hypothetical protein